MACGGGEAGVANMVNGMGAKYSNRVLTAIYSLYGNVFSKRDGRGEVEVCGVFSTSPMTAALTSNCSF
jgi:hypothetical protein